MLIDRLSARGGASYPKKKDWGTTDRKVVDYYNSALPWFYIRKDPNIGGKERVLYSAVVDPEILKDDLVELNSTPSSRPILIKSSKLIIYRKG